MRRDQYLLLALQLHPDLLGARLIYHPPGTNNWDVQLYGSNLLDKFYRLNGYSIPALGLDTGTVGLPRMYGLTVNVRYE